jgi:hypothetical protein
MKSYLWGAFALMMAASGAAAVETASGTVRPNRNVNATTSSTELTRAMAEARKREAERQKRWDTRMKRATGSLCDRC